MRSCYCNRMAITHKLSQHLGPRYQRLLLTDCCLDFKIALIDRTRIHDHIRLFHVSSLMPEIYSSAHVFQPICGGRAFQVRPRDAIALIEEHLSNSAHAGTANSDKVDGADTPHLRNVALVRPNHQQPPDRDRQYACVRRISPLCSLSAPSLSIALDRSEVG